MSTADDRQADSARPMLVERYRDALHSLFWYDNVQLILSRDAPDQPMMQRIVSELSELSLHCHSGTGALLVIRSDVRPPSEEARRYIARELARSSMVAAAQVVTGTGFVGAAMRSILTLVQTVARTPYPMKVFSDVGVASLWLTRELRARVAHAPDGAQLALLARAAQERLLTHSDVVPSNTRSGEPRE